MRRKKKAREAELGFGAEAPRGLTPADIQAKEFRLAFRGYHERDVDEFLDELTEELGRLLDENRRLREELDARTTTPLGGGLDAALASRTAEDILRRAREQAAAIVGDAERRARDLSEAWTAEAAPRGDAGVVSTFLSREREFLQSLAGLIQRHAEQMKELARALRRETGAGHGARREPSPPQEAVAAASPWEPVGAGGQASPGGPQPGEPSWPAGGALEPPWERPFSSPVEGREARPVPTDRRAGEETEGPGSRVIEIPEEPSLSEDPSPSGRRSEGGRPAAPEDGGDPRDTAEEPSLRELFWGEE